MNIFLKNLCNFLHRFTTNLSSYLGQKKKTKNSMSVDIGGSGRYCRAYRGCCRCSSGDTRVCESDEGSWFCACQTSEPRFPVVEPTGVWGTPGRKFDRARPLRALASVPRPNSRGWALCTPSRGPDWKTKNNKNQLYNFHFTQLKKFNGIGIYRVMMKLFFNLSAIKTIFSPFTINK